jgi:hypothetical protein
MKLKVGVYKVGIRTGNEHWHILPKQSEDYKEITEYAERFKDGSFPVAIFKVSKIVRGIKD